MAAGAEWCSCWLWAALMEKAMPSMAKPKMLMANRIKIMTLTALFEPCAFSNAGEGKGSVIGIKFCRFSDWACRPERDR